MKEKSKKYSRWVWLNEKQWNYWIILYQLKRLDKNNRPKFRISRNRLNKLLKISMERGEQTHVARHYWAKLWNLSMGESFDQISEIQQKYADLPDSFPNQLRWELLSRLTK